MSALMRELQAVAVSWSLGESTLGHDHARQLRETLGRHPEEQEQAETAKDSPLLPTTWRGPALVYYTDDSRAVCLDRLPDLLGAAPTDPEALSERDHRIVQALWDTYRTSGGLDLRGLR